MLFGKYHIVIFTEGRSGSRNVRMRGWFGIIACLLVLALVACNIWLLRNWLETRHLGKDGRKDLAVHRFLLVHVGHGLFYRHVGLVEETDDY